MASLLRRYLAGEHEAVWNEINALDSDYRSDIEAVAHETMRRVAVHIDRIAERLTKLGHEPLCAIRDPTSTADLVELDQLATEVGGLPVALTAMYEEVGAVSFLGDCSALRLTYHTPLDFMPDCPTMPPSANYPDPLWLPAVSDLRDALEARNGSAGSDDDDRVWLKFAPDELHKANFSGGDGLIMLLPDTSPNPDLWGPHMWDGGLFPLVDYLRFALEWGGFPGYQHQPEKAPAALDQLKVEVDF